MKKLLALTVLLSSTASFASDRAIYDIMYLPTAGTTYGFSEAEYLDNMIKGKSGADDVGATGLGFTQTLGHSFTDRLSVEAAIGYGDFRLDNENAKNSNQEGLTDPTINARFRVMDEVFRLDVLAGALFSIQDSEISHSGSDNLQGGNALNLGAQFGAKNEFFQWAILGKYTYNADREVEVLNTDVDVDSNNELLLRGDILNKLTESAYLRSFISADFTDAAEGEDGVGDFELAHTTYAIGTEYEYLFSANMLGRLGVDYDCVKQDTGFESSNTQWTIRLAANYQF